MVIVFVPESGTKEENAVVGQDQLIQGSLRHTMLGGFDVEDRGCSGYTAPWKFQDVRHRAVL